MNWSSFYSFDCSSLSILKIEFVVLRFYVCYVTLSISLHRFIGFQGMKPITFSMRHLYQ